MVLIEIWPPAQAPYGTFLARQKRPPWSTERQTKRAKGMLTFNCPHRRLTSTLRRKRQSEPTPLLGEAPQMTQHQILAFEASAYDMTSSCGD